MIPLFGASASIPGLGSSAQATSRTDAQGRGGTSGGGYRGSPMINVATGRSALSATASAQEQAAAPWLLVAAAALVAWLIFRRR